MSFTKLAQANLDHYNNHPVEHTAIAAVVLVAGVVLVRKAARRMAQEDVTLRSGQYAK